MKKVGSHCNIYMLYQLYLCVSTYNNNKILFLVEDLLFNSIITHNFDFHLFEPQCFWNIHKKKKQENVKKTYVFLFKSTQRIVFSIISKITSRYTYTDSGDRNNSGTRPKDQPL